MSGELESYLLIANTYGVALHLSYISVVLIGAEDEDMTWDLADPGCIDAVLKIINRHLKRSNAQATEDRHWPQIPIYDEHCNICGGELDVAHCEYYNDTTNLIGRKGVKCPRYEKEAKK